MDQQFVLVELRKSWQDWIYHYVMFKAHHPLGKLVDCSHPVRIFELFMLLQNLVHLNISLDGVGIFSVYNIFLAMLTRLDSRVKYNPRAVFTAAWERLKLEGPREYFA